ncbi:MAG TPA: VUT family protein, partial [Burkholderiaceae bacterium]
MNKPARSYQYYDLIMAAFVCVLLCSNLIGAGKAAQVTLPLWGTVTFGADLLFFPLSYIFGDVLTEVYGYGRDRRVVWAGFGALVFAAFMAFVVVNLPPAQNAFMAEYQKHVEGIFGNT